MALILRIQERSRQGEIYLDILIWGCVFVVVYAVSLWLFGMNRYERGIVTGVLGKFRRRRRRRR